MLELDAFHDCVLVLIKFPMTLGLRQQLRRID